MYIYIYTYKYTFSYSESFESKLERLYSYHKIFTCIFTKNKGNILFNQSQVIKMRKFNIDTVLLSSPESIFKLSIVLRIYKSSFRTKLYHCGRPPYTTGVQYLLTGFGGWRGTCSSLSALPAFSWSRSLGWEVVGTSVTAQYKG